MISSTSRQAYTDHQAAGRTGQQQAQVLKALEQGEMTRHQIAEATGLYPHSVCGRCNELMKVGLIEKTEPEYSSGRPRMLLRLASEEDAPRQEVLL